MTRKNSLTIKKLFAQVIILLMVIMFLSPIAFAQNRDFSVEYFLFIEGGSLKNDLSVTVKDAATNFPIDEANVTLKKGENIWSSGLTGDNGHRLFSNLSQGVYKIVVEKEGYNRYDEGEVTVEGVFKPDPPYGVVRGTL